MSKPWVFRGLATVPELIARVKTLELKTDWYDIAHILKVLKKRKAGDFTKLTKQMGIKPRVATHLLAILNLCEKTLITPPAHLGWRKISLLLPIATPQNVRTLLDLTTEKTQEEIQAMVASGDWEKLTSQNTDDYGDD